MSVHKWILKTILDKIHIQKAAGEGGAANSAWGLGLGPRQEVISEQGLQEWSEF